MNAPERRALLQMWAGVECTVNRVGDRFADQFALTGHDRRIADLSLLAQLGVSTLRYPVLWESVCPKYGGAPGWQAPDLRLRKLRRLGLNPIVGLVHHGSGPAGTSLIEPTFAPGLAGYAGAAARRYPWVKAFTPVNEPLTTARFSGLYGHWYPHKSTDRDFAQAVLNQCRAVVLSMEAIRRTIPSAELVQTEDLGQTHSTPALRHQADFENERRWLTWDLLCGRVDRTHPMWGYLIGTGIPEREVAWFLDHPCPPDVIGINHYLTSERFLDDRTDLYPAFRHGGNGRERYADVEAIRVSESDPCGLSGLLRQTWERYRLPIAITEAHLGCTREEQLRWLRQVWTEASAVRAEGVDIRAVTAWSAFGAVDWDSLVTDDRGHYESGLFDARTDPPRPTALAGLVRQLATGRTPDHPVLGDPGWWQRPDRLYRPAADAVANRPSGRPILIVGANATLGRACVRICGTRGLSIAAASRRDAATAAHAEELLDAIRPWAVVYTGASRSVDSAELHPEKCRREALEIPRTLAEICARRNLGFATFSTEQVFDGHAVEPYREADAVSPLNASGRINAEAETAVLSAHPNALIARTGTLFGARNGSDIVCQALRSLRSGGSFAAPDNLITTPSYLPDAIGEVLDLLIDGGAGVRHLASPEAISWAALAKAAVALAGLDPAAVEGRPASTFGWSAPRPVYTALATSLGGGLPPFESGLHRFIRESM